MYKEIDKCKLGREERKGERDKSSNVYGLIIKQKRSNKRIESVLDNGTTSAAVKEYPTLFLFSYYN